MHIKQIKNDGVFGNSIPKQKTLMHDADGRYFIINKNIFIAAINHS